jgi:hypothetical protein
MMADVRLIQEGMPGLVAADSLAYVLGHLVGQEAISGMAWRRAMVALGQDFPERQAMLDLALAARSSEPMLRLVPEEPGPRTCAACGRKGEHAAWCPLD